MATLSWVRRWGAVLAVSAVLVAGVPVVNAGTFAAAEQEAVCPSSGRMPPPTGTAPLYTDENVGVFVGGDLTATNSADGIEGLLVVAGNGTITRLPGTVHVGTVPLGSQIVPPPGGDMMIVGGDLAVAGDDLLNIGAGAVDAPGNLLGGNLAVGGTITGDGVIETNNGAIENPSSAADEYVTFPDTIATLSSNLADRNGSAGVVADGSVTFTGDGTTDRQFFTISADDLAGVDAVYFSNIAQGQEGEYPPIVVNVVGGPVAALSPNATWIDGVRVDDVYNPDFGNAAAAIMWNLPAVTDLTVGGTSQVLGSILVPARDSTVTVTSDTNGRVYVGGDLVVSGDGNVLHNYPWLGDPASDCRVSGAEETTSATLTKTLTPGSFLDYYPNSEGRLARFHGTVRCESPDGDIVTEHFTVRAGESFEVQGLPLEATCRVTEDLALTDQDTSPGQFVPVDMGDWEWARPVVEVDGVVTDEFTTAEGVRPSIALTNTLLGDFMLNKHSTEPAPEPFKIFWRAFSPTGLPQDGYVLADGETVADPTPNTSEGVVTVHSGEMGVRPFDPATGRPLVFPAGTRFEFDEPAVVPPPGYIFDGMDYWPRPTVIGPYDAHTVVDMVNRIVPVPVSMHLRKEVTGDAAHLVPPDTRFEITYLVNDVTAGQVLVSPNDEVTFFGDFRFGDRITLLEAPPPGIPGVVWGEPTFEPGAEFVVDSPDQFVTIRNEARPADASFQIRKELAGDGTALVPGDTPFTVDYTVNGTPADSPLTITADGTIVNGPTLRHDDVIGFSEVTPPDVPGVAWGAVTIDPPSLTLDAGVTPLVTVTNEAVARTGSFDIRKALDGEGAALVPPDTVFTVRGTVNGVPTPSLPTTVTADGTIVNGPEDLPEGAVVTYTEVTPPEIPGLVWEGARIDPPSVAIVAGETPLITVTNTFGLADAGFGVRKEVGGEAADRVPGSTEFTVDYWVNGVPADGPLTITADGTVVNGPVLKHGDVVRFGEVAPPVVPGVVWGPATIEPAEITLDAGADPPLVTVTNEATRKAATFQLRKAVDGQATGLVPGSTEFTVDYWVNGAPADSPLTITADGAVVNGPALKHGDVITFAEVVPPHIPGVAWAPVAIEPAELTLDAEAGTPVVTVANTADLAAATFRIRKQLTGDGTAAVPPDTEFTVRYSVNGTAVDEPLTVLADGTVVGSPALRHGDVVAFAEVVPPDVPGVTWGRTTIEPETLTLDAEAPEPSLVTVTNDVALDNASFRTRKVLTGNGAGAVPPDTEFTVEYSANGVPVPEPLIVRADGTIVDAPEFRHGDRIVLGEPALPAVPGIVWGTPVIEPSDFVLDAEATPVLATVTNEANLADATFRIHKEVTGNGADLVPPDTAFTVDYTVNGAPADTPLTILADGTAANGPALRHGDVVTFTEVTPPAVPGVAWGPHTITPETLTLDAEGEPVLVTVTNEAVERTGTFQIQKSITGTGARHIPDDTEFTVTYTVNGTPAATPLTLLADGTVVNGPDRLLDGDVIVFEESTPAALPGVEWGGATISPETITIDANAGTPLVVVTNTYTAKPASFQLRKAVTGDGAGLVPPDTAFTVDYTVNGAPADTPLTILADGAAVNGPALSHGDVLAFAEQPPPNVPGVVWTATTIEPAEIVLDAEAAAPVVTVTNEADGTHSALTVVKRDGVSDVPLGAAVFDLVLDDGDHSYDPTTDEVIGFCTTEGEDGSCTIGDLGVGTYFWVETAAPTGYLMPPDPVSAAIVIDAGNAGTALPPTTFHDPRLPTTVAVRKVDADTGALLAGAVFELRRDNGGDGVGGRPDEGDEVVGTCTTGADGTCSIAGVGFGDHYWYEITAPPGYVMPEDRTTSVTTIDAGNAGRPRSTTITNQALASTHPPTPPAQETAPEDGALPGTGANVVVPAVIGAALLLFGWLLLTARRRRQ